MKLEKCITVDNMNQKLLDIKYVVRGPIVQRSFEIDDELKKGVEKPFKHVVPAFIGDCHALGQKPITYIRQVVAAAACPDLLSSPDLPQDVKDRALEVLTDCPRGSVGAYSPPVGLRVVRESVAQFLRARDGVPSDPEDIFLGAGATDLIRGVLGMFVHQGEDGKPPAVMIPCPEYPLFSGSLSELGLRRADYNLYVEENWAIKREELERSWQEASKECHVRVLVIINPGNPTGQVLEIEEIEEIIKFAYERNLFIIADEVYQENIITKPFHSFKKVMGRMGPPYCNMELASFITASKGWSVECGLRCGAAELARLAPPVRAAFRTQRSLVQCPSVLGQAALHAVMHPPVAGSGSYAEFQAQRSSVQLELRLRAAAAPRRLNRIPGYVCGDIHAAMFAYPSIEIPERAQEAARAHNLEPDEYYCLQLLEETGICVVPGTGFGQRKGSFHIRITILSTAEEFQYLMDNIEAFHRRFLQKYS